MIARTISLIWVTLSWLIVIAVAQAQPPTGPETEKRFPPLVVPAGFKATLFACDPLIEYPSAVALGPRPGSIYLAIDYMTGLGTEIVRHDEIRLVEDTDGDGYADKATVYAEGFNSIEGLTYHGGTVYAMHAPFWTALRDTDGDGKADQRRDLHSGLGLPPEENPHRLHCANGLMMGHDGWLYLALGDHGCDVPRPEDDRLVLNGGGILRCRPDGSDLHVFATGLRNIYDVALDEDLNVFVRDNENDGGDYKIRVCHSFLGADHGYPYLYYERPDEALPPLADLGLGSSAGGLCYLENQFPAEYRGNLFFCEWGRAVVRYRPQRVGGGFAPVEEVQFAAAAQDDPYGFKPTDVVVERDGSLIVADWADGQKPKRGRGRVYRIRWVGEGAIDASVGEFLRNPLPSSLIAQLDSDSYYKRVLAQEAITAGGPETVAALREAIAELGRLGVLGRLHAVWILARDDSPSSHETLFNLAQHDADSRVRAQAVRALADLADPVLAQHRLSAGRGDAVIAQRLSSLADKNDPRVLLDVIVAMGRLRWPEAPAWLQSILTDTTDPAIAHAAMQALRRSENWPRVLELLDLPASGTIRPIAVRAIADQAVPAVVDGLINRLGDRDPVRRREYSDALTRVHKQPAEWVYWGYRPPPRPPSTVAWERTAAIEQALDRMLADADRTVRLAVLRRMQREKIPTRLPTLDAWLATERSADSVAAILDALRDHTADQRRKLLSQVVVDTTHAPPNRLSALAILAGDLMESDTSGLLEIAQSVEDGPVLAALLRELQVRRRLDAVPLFKRRLTSPHAGVRTQAIDALAALDVADAAGMIENLLSDDEPAVRRASAAAMGRLGVRSAVERLLQLAKDADPAVRRASLESLRQLGEPRAVPLAVTALADRQTQATALACLAELGGPQHAEAVIDLASRDPSVDTLPTAIALLTDWADRSELPTARRLELEHAVAELHGRSGLLIRWRASSPLAEPAATQMLERLSSLHSSSAVDSESLTGWRTLFATGVDARVSLAPAAGAEEPVWLAYTDLIVPESAPVQFLASSSGKFQVWLNGRRLYERGDVRAFQADSDRFDGTLLAGNNRVVVQSAATSVKSAFHMRFRRKSSAAELEQLVQAALARPGNPERGRKLFFDQAKTQCSKCHRLGDEGERIGPELTGVGDRFARIHIVESILEPSRTVAPGFQTLAVVLQDGRLITGIKVAESEEALTLADNQGKQHLVAKDEIDQQHSQPHSTMPDGLTKLLSANEFVDLIAFLASQKREVGQ